MRFGRIGTSGQTKTKTLESPEAAAAEMEALIREKTKKGYVETKGESPLPGSPVDMESMHQALSDIKEWLTDQGATAVVEDLQPPATESEIEAVEKELGYRLPAELREFYRLHNGQAADEDMPNHFFRYGIGAFVSLRFAATRSSMQIGSFISPWFDPTTSETERQAWERESLRVKPEQKVKLSYMHVSERPSDAGETKLLPAECSTAWFVFATLQNFCGLVHLASGRVFAWTKEEGLSLQAESFGAFLAGFASDLWDDKLEIKLCDEETDEYERSGWYWE